jgi:pseudouridine-5'-phosphate glycosidase
MEEPIRMADEVREALAAGRPVVALETSVVAHGLPAPFNLDAARRVGERVRASGAVPAFVAVLRGRIVLGADRGELERLADPATGAAKAQARDLGALAASGRDAGTTVSATVAVAALAGIRVVATGGIGGVHRVPVGAPPAGAGDVSADLVEIARRPVCVVSAGPKAVLDLHATAEALETLGVPTIGYGTREMPAFYSEASGVPLEHSVDDERAVAAVARFHWEVLRREEGLLLFVPPPSPVARARVEAAIEAGLFEAREQGVRGKAVTPFLLEAVSRATGGATREANVALLERNAAVAGGVASALATSGSRSVR